MPEKLTDRLVKGLVAPAKGNAITYDTDVTGFGARITAAGKIAFILNYSSDGHERRLTIGQYPTWSVAGARKQAEALRREVDQGRDPLGERQEQHKAPTVADLWTRYRDEHVIHNAPKQRPQIAIMWRDHILPDRSHRKVADITASDCDALHRAVTARGTPIQANRVLASLRKAFSLAIRWGWRTDNPASGVRMNGEVKRERYLSAPELERLGQAMLAHPERISVDAIRLILMTGCRRGEALSAGWDQFDLDAGVWVKPSAHTKQRKTHRAPLPQGATVFLRDLRARTDGAFLFPGPTDGPLKDVKRTWASLCRMAGIDGARVHDLRHTYASILASAGLSLPMIGALLGHTQTQTTARYAHLFDSPLRQGADAAMGPLAAIFPAKADGP